MLGVGTVAELREGVREVCDAGGPEVTSLVAGGSGACTVANGLRGLSGDPAWQALVDVARASSMTKAALGDRHGVGVTALGTVFTWGDRSDGRCGVVAATPVNPLEPSLVTALEAHTIVDVAAGEGHSLALAGAWACGRAGSPRSPLLCHPCPILSLLTDPSALYLYLQMTAASLRGGGPPRGSAGLAPHLAAAAQLARS